MTREDAEKKLAALKAKEAERDVAFDSVKKTMNEVSDLIERATDLLTRAAVLKAQQRTEEDRFRTLCADADALRAEFLAAVAEEAER